MRHAPRTVTRYALTSSTSRYAQVAAVLGLAPLLCRGSVRRGLAHPFCGVSLCCFTRRPRSVAIPGCASRIDRSTDPLIREPSFHVTSTLTISRASGTKRRAHPSPSDIPSPERKRNAYAHFQPGRVVDDRINRIPDCVRAIIEDGHKSYMPLHLLAEEVLDLEAAARLSARPGEAPVVRAFDIIVTEDRMTTDLYGTWSKLHILALELLEISPWVIKMFQSHYDLVQTARDYRSAWPAWRLYDIRRRQLVRGHKPMDISMYDHALFSRITNELSAKALVDFENARQRVDSRTSRSARPSYPGPSTSALGNASGSTASASSRNAQGTKARSGGGALAKLKFGRCLACGSRAHLYDKDVPSQCESRWLVFDSALGNHKTPTSGTFVCWAWNSDDGCKLAARCRRKDGHVCSLCGSAAHGSQTCSA